jgi:hypothetical protein
MNNCCICWIFTHFLLGILIFKGLTARRLYKSLGVKGLNTGHDGVQCYSTQTAAPFLYSITANCRFEFISIKQDARIPALMYRPTEFSFYDAAETKRKRCTSPQCTQCNYKLEQK